MATAKKHTQNIHPFIDSSSHELKYLRGVEDLRNLVKSVRWETCHRKEGEEAIYQLERNSHAMEVEEVGGTHTRLASATRR